MERYSQCRPPAQAHTRWCAPGSHAATSRDVGSNSWVPPHSMAQYAACGARGAGGGSSREPDGRGQMRCGRGRPVPHLCGVMPTRFGAHREAITTMFRQASSFDPMVPSCGLVCRQVTFAHITRVPGRCMHMHMCMSMHMHSTVVCKCAVVYNFCTLKNTDCQEKTSVVHRF